MNYQEFTKNIVDYVSNQISEDHKISIHQVLKNNGTTYDGLIITHPFLNISPTIYLNPYYHRYLDGVNFEDICEDILKTYRENQPVEDFDISSFKDFDKASQRILMKLVHRERNDILLEDVPFIPFYDLAIIFVCSVCDYMDEYATILIHTQHLDLWGISIDELYEIAQKNTPSLLPYDFNSMEKILEHLIDKPLPFVSDINMYLLTNSIRIHGATCIVYPKLLEKISDRLEDDLILLPSSIHEVLIIPKSTIQEDYELSDLNEMIVEINETQLTDDEILSDHAYIYNRSTKKLEY